MNVIGGSCGRVELVCPMTSTALTPSLIKRAPKVLLHEHLDGGLRPATVIELARKGYFAGLPDE
jgi:adenosine deaminase